MKQKSYFIVRVAFYWVCYFVFNEKLSVAILTGHALFDTRRKGHVENLDR